MMFKRFLYGSVFTAAMLGGIPFSASAQGLVVEGSRTIATSLLAANEQDVEALSHQEITIIPSDSPHGIEALVDGDADMAMISAPLDTVVSALKSYEYDYDGNFELAGRIDEETLIAHKIGESTINFVVNPMNPIRALSQDQLFAILAGHITDWSQVGGPAMPIVIMTAEPGCGAWAVVEHRLLESGDHLQANTYLRRDLMVVRAASQFPGALGVTSTVHVNEDVVVLNTGEPLTQPLFLVTRGQPDARLTAVIHAVRTISAGANSS